MAGRGKGSVTMRINAIEMIIRASKAAGFRSVGGVTK
jgi:hypothetical protein